MPLSDKAEKLRADILAEYNLSPAELEVLDKSLEALDLCDKANTEIDNHGVLVYDRFDKLVRNPAIGVAKDARAQFYAGMKQLGLADPYGGESKQGRGAQKGRQA